MIKELYSQSLRRIFLSIVIKFFKTMYDMFFNSTLDLPAEFLKI